MTIQRRDIPDRALLRTVADRWVAMAARADGAAYPPGLDALMAPYPAKVVERKLEHLAARGLVEYAGNVWQAWLTDAGREVLSGGSLLA